MSTPGSASLPGLIIAGTNKSGTSSLWSYVAEHPGVTASDVKETCYWLPLRHGAATLPPLSAYAAHWDGAPADTLLMEATPAYFYGGRRIAEAIDRACPEVKIVIVLREPARRALSFMRYRQSILHLPTDLTFREYVAACRALSESEVLDRTNNRYFALRGGCYVEHMPVWSEVFTDRLKVVFFDDLTGDPRGLVADLCRWLDLDMDPVGDLGLESKNVTTSFRNERLQRAALGFNERADALLLRNPRLRRGLVSLYRRVNGKPAVRGDDSDERAVVAELEQWFAAENAGLRAMVEPHALRAIPAWVT